MNIQIEKKDQTPGSRLSISQVRMWLKCPRQWAYRYVAGIKSPPGWALLAGSAWDGTLNVHNSEKLTGKGLSLSTATDMFEHVLREELAQKGEPPDGSASPSAVVDKGTRSMKVYMRDHDPSVEPLEVQKEVEVAVGGVAMKGYVDLVRKGSDGHRIVSDNKFKYGGRKPYDLEAANSMQLAYYERAAGDGSGHVELVHTVPYKTEPKVIVQAHFVTPAQHAALDRTVKVAQAQMQTKLYPQVSVESRQYEDSYPCSAKWCGYWSICRGSKTGVPQAIPGEMEV